MKHLVGKRLLPIVLALVLCLGLAAPGWAAESRGTQLQFEQVDNSLVSASLKARRVPLTAQEMEHSATERVRVSIVLEDEATLAAGYCAENIAENASAMRYRQSLRTRQEQVAQAISTQALNGQRLDVVWNLTLAANIISANVQYGQIEAIAGVEGVADVFVETRYSPNVAETGAADPSMATSSDMIGSNLAWASGYTGVGSRIAVIDTGTDTDHQSFDADAFMHAVGEDADLMDASDIARVLNQLNIMERNSGVTADRLYLNEKLPFAFNYIDKDFDITHDNDFQGEHGSHVAGIATANRYIKDGDSYVEALEAVNTQGVAPDAQLITMKVFGKNGGAYDSDYMAAVEDAIILGANSINLSLGVSNPGMSTNATYQKLLDSLAEHGAVLCVAAGNSYSWQNNTLYGYLYHDGVSMQTNGAPGSYTNTLAVASVENSTGDAAADAGYTMSDFSSWGVPGSLELKPEITAPGGNIYSVNGADKSGQAYEYMSGTSMATPQMSGMVAVLAQYFRESKLTETTGLSARQLAQSLLMSTAEPLFEEASGSYYSVLKQGAGLANIHDAINARSYITMEPSANAGAADGKVKVELGDDPARGGVYSFSYELHNLSDATAFYSFDTAVFTQGVFTEDANTFLDTQTVALAGAAVTHTVQGSDYTNNRQDVQRVLDAVAGKLTLTGEEQELYDRDGDGKITSYDAHLMLLDAGGEDRIAVPAGGSVTVTVTLDVSGCDFSAYPTGAYIEAYSYAREYTLDGESTTHSIPVLGYYGSWSEPSMYDVGTLTGYLYGMEERLPYLYEQNQLESNYFSVCYPGDSSEYQFVGNALVEEDAYLEQRNAMSSGTTLSRYYVTVIRNAADAKLEIRDANTQTLYHTQELGALSSAYYSSSAAKWNNAQTAISVGWQATDLSGVPLPEGTEVEISLILAPEYYVTEAGTDWNALAEGSRLTTRVAIDNMAPTMTALSYDAKAGTLTLKASDNRYLACAALYQNGAEAALIEAAPNQQPEDMGKTLTQTLDVSTLGSGAELYIQLTDYAMNQSTYKFVLTDDGVHSDKVAPETITLPAAASMVKGTTLRLTPVFTPFLAKEEVIWSSDNEAVATVDESGMVTGIGAGTAKITAISQYNDDVFATCAVTVKAYDVTLTGMLQDEDGNPQLFTWNLETDKTWTKTAELENDIHAAAYDLLHENAAFQMSTAGLLHRINPVTGETLESSASAIAFGAPVSDLAYGATVSEQKQEDVLLAVYGAYFLYSNPAMGNTFRYGWNLANYLSSNLSASGLTAIAWAGSTTNKSGNQVDIFYCLTDTGDIWVMMPDFSTSSAKAEMNYYITDLELDFPGYDGSPYCSMVMGGDGNLYLSYFNGSTNEIYVLEYHAASKKYEATLLGDVGDSVWPAALLTATSNGADAQPELWALPQAEALCTAQAEALRLPTPEASGATQSVKTSAERQSVSGSTVKKEQQTVTVTVTESEATTNGKYVVEYDPAAVAFQSGISGTPYSSIHDDGAGTITIAFAAEAAQTPGTVAELTFTALTQKSSTVTVSTEERGSNVQITGEQEQTTISFGAVPGDLNGDGDVTAADALLLAQHLLGSCELTGEQKELADLNGDGSITSADAVLLAKEILK